MSGGGEVRRSWPGPEYVTRVTFDAPLAHSFRWCTDYSAIDPQLEKEEYARRVLERGPRRVVYEDLASTKAGWSWARYVVTLQPPDRWHMESIGTARCAVGDYLLTPLSGDRTRFELRYRRKPGLLPFRRVPKKERDPQDLVTWLHFKRALEKDYRASLGRRRRSRGR